MRTHATCTFLVCLFFAAYGQENRSDHEKNPVAQAFKQAGLDNLAFEQSLNGGSIERVPYHSAYLGEERTMYVYVPACNDTSGCDEKTYPTIYFLHPSGFGKHGSWGLDGLRFLASAGSNKLDFLIVNHKIKPMIAVFPDGSEPHFGGSFYTNSDLYGPFDDHIVAEVTSIVDSLFPTKNNRTRRGIMGHSMGGYGAMKLAFNNWTQYSAVASHSGPLDLALIPTVIDSVLAEYNGAPYFYSPSAGKFSEFLFQMSGAFSPNLTKFPHRVDLLLDNSGNLVEPVFAKWILHNPARLARQMPPLGIMAFLKIYFDVGEEDELGLFPFNQAFCDSLVASGLELGRDFEYQPYEGGGHENPAVLLGRVEKSLVFMDSVLALTYGCNKSATQVVTKQLAAIGFEPSGAAAELELRLYDSYQEQIDDIYSVLAQCPEIQFEIYHAMKEAKAFVNGTTGGSSLKKNLQPAFASTLYRLQDKATDPGTKNFLRVIIQVVEDTTGHTSYEEFLASVVKHLERNSENRSAELDAVDNASLKKYRLEQNYPNPFNPTTTIKIHLTEEAHVRLSVYNMTGQKVATLANHRLPAGEQSFTWNATGHASGVYFVKLEAVETIQIKKMILLQ